VIQCPETAINKATDPVFDSFDMWAHEKEVVYVLTTSTQWLASAQVKSRPSPDYFYTMPGQKFGQILISQGQNWATPSAFSVVSVTRVIGSAVL